MRGRRVTRAMIIEHVWNLSFDTATNLVDVYVAFLRVVFEASVVSAQHLSYREYLQRLPEVTYLCSGKLTPMDVPAVLQLDLSIAFPLIDLLLGGKRQRNVRPEGGNRNRRADSGECSPNHLPRTWRCMAGVGVGVPIRSPTTTDQCIASDATGRQDACA